MNIELREPQTAFAVPLVRAVHDESRSALGDDFVGMILLGSLASGDFDPLRSDVDFLVVTRVQPNAAQFEALRTVHARVRQSALPFASNYEGVYVPLSNLRRYRHDDVHAWLGSDGHFAWETQGSDWILQRHVAREHGLVVCGPHPRDLIDAVPAEERIRAAADLLHEWWAPMLTAPQALRDAEYQAYAILTMCRARYTLATAEIASKPIAARWLADRCDARTAAGIARALHWQRGDPLDELDVALRLIREALDAAA